LIAGITLTMVIALTTENNKALAQQQQQQNQTQASIPHNAKGHESHQIVNFQNSSDGATYAGTVTFNSSKPVDIISFEDVTGKQNANTTIKLWESGDKKLMPTTLLKNITEGSVQFNGSGILAHTAQSNPYSVTFTLNATVVNGKGQ
jgi:mannose/fructose-specific phosphotransferase system component IIA